MDSFLNKNYCHYQDLKAGYEKDLKFRIFKIEKIAEDRYQTFWINISDGKLTARFNKESVEVQIRNKIWIEITETEMILYG